MFMIFFRFTILPFPAIFFGFVFELYLIVISSISASYSHGALLNAVALIVNQDSTANQITSTIEALSSYFFA